jgi:hypothetical protein
MSVEGKVSIFNDVPAQLLENATPAMIRCFWDSDAISSLHDTFGTVREQFEKCLAHLTSAKHLTVDCCQMLFGHDLSSAA